jgi:hypothetical protein
MPTTKKKTPVRAKALKIRQTAIFKDIPRQTRTTRRSAARTSAPAPEAECKNAALMSELVDAPRFRVVYVKKDKSIRSASGKILPEHRVQTARPDFVCYFDFGIMAVRSFRVDSVRSYEVIDD